MPLGGAFGIFHAHDAMGQYGKTNQKRGKFWAFIRRNEEANTASYAAYSFIHGI
jgi:hypothetical protein